jgi:hypothetical protein
MDTMSKDEANTIIDKVKSVGVDEPCRRCGNTEFGFVHSRFFLSHSPNSTRSTMGSCLATCSGV